MKSSVPDRLRREVRLAVHRACMRRHTEGGTSQDLDVDAEVSAAFEREGIPLPETDVLHRWMEEDQADFDRAVLVSELISLRQPVASGSAPASESRRTSPAPAKPRPRAAPEPTPSAAPGGAPSIADMLDGMLAQQRRR